MTCMSKSGGCSGVTPNARQVASDPATRPSASSATPALTIPSATTVPEPTRCTCRSEIMCSSRRRSPLLSASLCLARSIAGRLGFHLQSIVTWVGCTCWLVSGFGDSRVATARTGYQFNVGERWCGHISRKSSANSTSAARSDRCHPVEEAGVASTRRGSRA